MKARFFLDNCLSPRFARALRELAEPQGFEIVHHGERFERNAPDADWLHALGVDGGWIIVSGDPRITRSKVERSAWQESGLTAFFFAGGWSSKSYWKQAADVVLVADYCARRTARGAWVGVSYSAERHSAQIDFSAVGRIG